MRRGGGRPRALTPSEESWARKMRFHAVSAMTVPQIAAVLKVSKSTIMRTLYPQHRFVQKLRRNFGSGWRHEVAHSAVRPAA